MADISQQINAINSARYGEEVRGSIVTALTAVNNQVEDDETSAGASATAAAASAAQAQAAEENLADAIAAAEQTEEDIEAAEALRVTAEQGRVDAENARVAAEQAREDAETGYVAQAQAAAAQAQQYASSDYVKTAQSWAIGGTSSRYGEDTNNAKYWAEIAAEVVTEGGVGSFNGRTGQVLPAAGDYDTTMITRGTGSAESALAAIESGIGTTTLPTTAQTLTGAIAEHESDISALNGKLEYGSFTTFSTFTPISCTGTVSGSLYFKTSSSRWVYFSGRINIANYARTGGNPGVSFTLPTGIPTPTETTNIPVGINSLFPREQVNIRLTAGSRTAQFTTTESFSNSTGNVLTFMFTPVFFYVP